jgi:hypothetical protein
MVSLPHQKQMDSPQMIKRYNGAAHHLHIEDNGQEPYRYSVPSSGEVSLYLDVFLKDDIK